MNRTYKVVVTEEQLGIINNALLMERDRLLRDARRNDRPRAKELLNAKAGQVEELRSAVVYSAS